MAQFLVFAQLTFRQQGAWTGVPSTDKGEILALILQTIKWNGSHLHAISSKFTVMKSDKIKFST
jgi:hypothetical protein